MFKMTVMWCSSSFSSYLLNYMNKYLEGSIYENHYNEGIAGCIATFIGASIYAKLGKRFAFIMSFSLALIGGLVILVLEGRYYQLPGSFVDEFPGISFDKRNASALDFIVPKLIFIAKFGISLAFLCTY